MIDSKLTAIFQTTGGLYIFEIYFLFACLGHCKSKRIINIMIDSKLTAIFQTRGWLYVFGLSATE